MEDGYEGGPKREEVSANFDVYIYAKVARLDDEDEINRLNNLSDFLTESLAVTDSTVSCNAMLSSAGRPDLVIDEPVEMMGIDKPEDVTERCSNFTPSFHIYSGRAEPEEDSPENMAFIPMSREEVLKLRDLPIVKSYEDLLRIQESGDIKLPYNAYITHVARPAFVRMLILFPDFTVDLVSRLSSPEGRHSGLRFTPELFIAYQLMSRLVDVDDVKEGKPDDWYLCH